MTPKISLNKSAFSVFKFTLKKNIGFSLIAAVLAFLISPIYMYNTISDYVERYKKLVYEFDSLFPTFSLLAAIATTAFLMVLLYINFSYLYKRSASDFFQALPLKRSELLFARFGAAYLAAVIPLVVGYAGAFGLTFLDYVAADRVVILQSFIYTLVMLLALGLYTLLYILVSGGIFDSLIALSTVNIGIPVIALFIYGLCSEHLYGFNANIDSEILAYTSPFGYAITRLVALFGNLDGAAPFLEWKHTLATVALTVIPAVLAVVFYNRRKSEKTNGAYAFKFVPEVIGAIVSALGLFIFAIIFSNNYDSVAFWAFGFAGAMLASVVYYLIITRGFKKVVKSLIVGAVSFVLILLINFGIQFDILGWENVLPLKNSIKSVSISVKGYEMETDDIDLALRLNKAILEDKELSESENAYNNQYICFEYTLKSGRKVSRNYDVEYLAAAEEKVELINKEMPAVILAEYEEIKPYGTYDWEYSNYSYTTSRYNSEDKISNKRAEDIVNAYVNDLKTVGLEYFDNETDDDDKNIYLGKTVKLGQTVTELDGGKGEYTDYREYYLYIRDYKIYPSVNEVVNSLVKDENLSTSYLDENQEMHYVNYYK